VEVVDAERSDLGDCVETRKVAANGAGKPAEANGCVPTKRAALLLLGKTGEIHRLPIGEVTSVKPTDPAVAARLGSAVDALSHRGAQARRDLRVLSGASKSIALGYIAETPVWRSTYRLVLSDNDKGALQGWALLHNDTDEDWKQVKVELVNGRPDSFLFPLASPRYARRELVTPDNELSTVPQLLDTTVDAMWTGDGASGMGLSGTGEGGGGTGQGIGLGSIGTIGHGSGTGSLSSTGASSLLSVGNLAEVAQAEGIDGGVALYALKSSVDAARRLGAGSLASEWGARRIALFTRRARPPERRTPQNEHKTIRRTASILDGSPRTAIDPLQRASVVVRYGPRRRSDQKQLEDELSLRVSQDRLIEHRQSARSTTRSKIERGSRVISDPALRQHAKVVDATARYERRPAKRWRCSSRSKRAAPHVTKG
jgi:hypothetical protein